MAVTRLRYFRLIYNEIESVGVAMGFDSGVHNTRFGGVSLSEALPLLLTLLSESLRAPTFPVDEIDKLRAQLLTGLAIRAQDTSDMAALIFDQMLYPEHPYGRPEDGFVNTIQAITRDDLEEFHRLHFGPRSMVISIVGAIEPKEAVEEVSRGLGGSQAQSQGRE